jgi:hypothetical protein
VPGFDPARNADRLRAVQHRIDADGPAEVRRQHFWFRATRRAT